MKNNEQKLRIKIYPKSIGKVVTLLKENGLDEFMIDSDGKNLYLEFLANHNDEKESMPPFDEAKASQFHAILERLKNNNASQILNKSEIKDKLNEFIAEVMSDEIHADDILDEDKEDISSLIFGDVALSDFGDKSIYNGYKPSFYDNIKKKK